MAEVWTPPAFDDISTSELVTAAQLNAFGNSLRFLKEVEYEQFTADVSVTATTAATAVTVISASAITYEAVPHLIEFFCPSAQTGASAAIRFNLWDSGTDIGRWAEINSASVFAPVKLEYRLTPTAASHTYIVKAWRVAANGTLKAGSGGVDTYLPGFIRVTRVPT